MNVIYNFIINKLDCFFSPFYLLFILLIIKFIIKDLKNHLIALTIISGFTFIYFIIYKIISINPDINKWLSRLNHPLYLTLTFLVLPAIFISNKKYKILHFIFCLFFIILGIFEVIYQYSIIPIKNNGFIYFPIRDVFLILSVTAVLVILGQIVPTEIFRKIVKISVFIILIYGGFAFRQDYKDYIEMISRRRNYKENIFNLSETIPVMKSDNQIYYVPSAPCRFSADGGYVQGCVMELMQRILQIKIENVFKGIPGDTMYFAIALAALLVIIVFLFIGARFWCGWGCPLSTIGDLIDYIRVKLKLPHLKITQPVRLSVLFSGISLSSIGLAFALAYSKIDQNGKFMGCKIPLYPFCKICPGQQICPVVAKGIDGITPLASMDWFFGFFRYASIAILFLFIIGFIFARRLWCRFCPMGMIGGLFNKGAMLALKKNNIKCNNCGVCSETCPMDIHSVQNEKKKQDVSNFNCIYCLKCIDLCPQDGCLSLEFAGKKIKESKF